MELNIIEGETTVVEILAGLKGDPGDGGTGGGSGVKTINGVSPDVSGNSVITPASIGALSTSYAPDWGVITGKPSTFTPSSHTHAESDITGLTSDLAGKADDSLAAHLAGTETITGAKTFTGGVTVTSANVTITDRDIVLGTATGTKFGTSTSQKIGFFNATPIVQVGATIDLGTVLSNLGLRASGTAYPLSTTGAVALTGQTQLGYQIRTAQNAISTNTTLGTHHKSFVDATSGAVTITLPTAASVGGLEYVVQKVDSSANAVVIATTSAQTINGVTASNFNLTKQWQTLKFVSNGTNWTTMSSNQIHNHDGADIVSGTIATARLGSGTANGTTFLRGDGTWAVPAGGGGGSTTLSGLTDVTITAAATGDFLRYNGSAWADYVLGKSDVGLSNVDNTSDATKNSAVASLTNKDLTSGTNTFPTFNQNTTGTAARWTTARLLAGNSTTGAADVPFANKFIVQGTTDSGLTNAQFLGALGTGIVKNTTTTGVLSIAVAADFPTLNQNTNGSAATLGTARTINGVSFNGSANVQNTLTQISAPTADFDLNSHKFTGLTAGTAAGHSVRWDEFSLLSDDVAGKLDQSGADVAALLPGLTIEVLYDSTNGWVLPSGYSTNANVGWLFLGGDDAHAPPTVTSTRALWVHA